MGVVFMLCYRKQILSANTDSCQHACRWTRGSLPRNWNIALLLLLADVVLWESGHLIDE